MGITIREIRKDKLGMSMREMADLLGISRTGYWKKETGRNNFKPQEIIQICKMSDVDPRTLSL